MTQVKSSDKARRHALPRNYLTILDVLHRAGVGTHLSAVAVFERTRATSPRLGLATVHRGLARLVELGLLAKVELPGAASCLYEPAREPHAHFRCDGCGLIRDVDFRIDAQQLADLGGRLGCRIDLASTTFAGRCTSACAGDAGAI